MSCSDMRFLAAASRISVTISFIGIPSDNFSNKSFCMNRFACWLACRNGNCLMTDSFPRIPTSKINFLVGLPGLNAVQLIRKGLSLQIRLSGDPRSVCSVGKNPASCRKKRKCTLKSSKNFIPKINKLVSNSKVLKFSEKGRK